MDRGGASSGRGRILHIGQLDVDVQFVLEWASATIWHPKQFRSEA